jgi:sterol desaturase/sphingolipid hydroxylase (fatty acid hydroxylase superfamily)
VPDLKVLALPIFAILIVTEAVVSALRQQQAYELKDFGGSMSQLAMNILIKLGFDVVVIGFHFTLYQYRFFDWAGPLQWLVTLVALDFVFYWYHRASHRSRFLWAAHVVHHSSERMNFGTALRQSPTGPLTRALFYWPLPLLGFDPLVIASAGAVATLYGFWTHTEQINKLWPPLEYIFVTPSHHRAHHGSNPEYIDKNYANFLIIWDRLFGTFEEEQAQVQYGLINNINTYNPLRIAFHEWATLFKDVMHARSIGEAWQRCFNPPGWKPAPAPLPHESSAAGAEAH